MRESRRDPEEQETGRATRVTLMNMKAMVRRGKNLGRWTRMGRWCAAALIAFKGYDAAALEASDVLLFEVGPLSIRPSAGVFTQYNDNIFLRNTQKEADVLFGIFPGVKFLVGSDIPDENKVSLQYRMDQHFYLENSRLDATQHKLAFDVEYSTSRTSIKGTDRLEFLSSTIGGVTINDKVDRTVWDDSYNVEYTVSGRTSVYVEASHNQVDYDRGTRLFDVRELQGTGGFAWKLSDETRIFGEAHVGMIDLKSNLPVGDPPGRKYVGGFIGARGNFTPKISGMVKAGFDYNTFDDSGVLATSLSDSSLSPTVQMNVSYAITDRTSVSLGYSRAQRVSVEFTRSAYTLDDITASSRIVMGSTGRLRLDVGTRIGFFEYEPAPSYATRSDRLYGANTALTYFFQTWLAADLRYDFTTFRSDLTGISDYDQHRISMGLVVGF